MTGKSEQLAKEWEQIFSLSMMRQMDMIGRTYYVQSVRDVLSSMPVPNMPSSTKSTDSGVT